MATFPSIFSEEFLYFKDLTVLESRKSGLTSRLTVVELIANTRTKTGLSIRCELDTQSYPKGIKVSDEAIASLNLKGDEFHPEWNYTISPGEQKVEQ